MKKILIASYDLRIGGIEKSLVNLLKSLDYCKYEVTLFLEHINGNYLNDIPKNVKVYKYNVSNNNHIFLRKTCNLFKKIKFILFNYRRFDSSICYATYSKPDSFLARVASKNSLIFVHSNYYLAYNKDIEKVKSFFDDICIEKFKKIVFVSNESRNDILSIFPNIIDKSYVINNIVDYKKILKLSNDYIVEKSNKKIVLFVGRLDESSKRITKLLEIAEKSKLDNLNVEFWIIGDGPNIKMYKKMINTNNLNNVIMFGSKNNPYPYFKKCNYVILTSKYEGFPVVYNEAIIFKKPIITTIDVSDDYISIKNRYGYILSEKNMYNDFKEIICNKKKFKIEDVDFEEINRKRMNKIEKLLENCDD